MDAPALEDALATQLATPLASYLNQLASQRKLSALTVAAYGRDLRELALLSGAPSWDAISHHDVRRLAARLHGQGIGPRSIARKLSSLRGFYAWLAGEQPLAANPVDGVKAPRAPKTLPKALSVE